MATMVVMIRLGRLLLRGVALRCFIVSPLLSFLRLGCDAWALSCSCSLRVGLGRVPGRRRVLESGLGLLPDALASSQQGHEHVNLHSRQDLGRPVLTPPELMYS